MQAGPQANRPPELRSQRAREACSRRAALLRGTWPVIFAGTWKVGQQRNVTLGANQRAAVKGGAPGRFPVVSKPVVGNNTRQMDPWNAAERATGRGLPGLVHY